MPVALLAQAGPKGPAYACKDCASRPVQKPAACKAFVSMGFYVLGAQGPPPYFLQGPAHSIRLLWFPIGFMGPMRCAHLMLPIICILSQLSSPEEPPPPQLLF